MNIIEVIEDAMCSNSVLMSIYSCFHNGCGYSFVLVCGRTMRHNKDKKDFKQATQHSTTRQSLNTGDFTFCVVLLLGKLVVEVHQ